MHHPPARENSAQAQRSIILPDTRDPEPSEDNNFVDPETGKEYNYRAVATLQVLVQLERGMLTRYPLQPIREPTDSMREPKAKQMIGELVTFDTFLSHNSKDKPVVRSLADSLVARGLRPWLDERELVPGRPWQEALEQIIQTAKTASIMFGPSGLGPWEEPEMRACLNEFVVRKLPVIPVLLPGAPQQPNLPLFLKSFTWVDLRAGLTDEGLGS